MIRIEAELKRERKGPPGSATADREQKTEYGDDLIERIERMVIENPARSLSIALALGVTLGWYFKRT